MDDDFLHRGFFETEREQITTLPTPAGPGVFQAAIHPGRYNRKCPPHRLFTPLEKADKVGGKPLDVTGDPLEAESL